MAKLKKNNEEAAEKTAPASRSAKKRESTALQKLGENLTKIKAESRKDLPLSEDLLQALAFHDSLTNKEACRRQRQFIGKLMRNEDTAAIYAALERLESPKAQQLARFHAAERWREKLLASSEISELVEEFISANGLNADANDTRDLLSLAERAQAAGGTDPALKRNLFRQILALLEKGAS